MNNYTLKRLESLPDGTFGVIMDEDDNLLCHTAELPWLMNGPDKSCIPAASYICMPYSSPHHPGVWQVTDVPSRSGILIHNGNIPEIDSLGCIILGLERGQLNGADAVLESNLALTKMRGIWVAPFQLQIVENLV